MRGRSNITVMGPTQWGGRERERGEGKREKCRRGRRTKFLEEI